ncbi:MAG: lamin tail domain-containing protein [Phycisphaerae bacterium]|nr:lamin tail domain-containing protein [Phycisphaerae bacterium]
MSPNRDPLIEVQPMLEALEPRLLLDGAGEPDPLELIPQAAAAPAATSVDARQFNPSSRMGGLIVSEIMYNPLDPDGVGGIDASALEFIEIYNSEEVANDMSRYELTGEADYVFPEGTVLAGRSYLVVASNPAAVESFYGITDVLGPYDDLLSNTGGTVRLRNQMNAVLQDIQYSDDYPWPAEADGAGYSLVMTKPDFGEDSVLAWEASDYLNGNPGTYNRTFEDDLANVVINEVLSHTDLPQIDFVELYNHSNSSVDIGGLTLTDGTDPLDPSYTVYTIPSLTTIAPRGFISFDQTTLGFSFDMQGDRAYLRNDTGDRMIDAIKFGAQKNGVAYGRSADGADEFRVLSSTTPGMPNATAFHDEIVINEIMYHPISQDTDDEFIELYNRGASDVDLTNWKFTEGINYTFPVDPHQEDTIGFGDNSTTLFSGTLLQARLRAGTIVITDGLQIVTDDGFGNLIGDVHAGGSNTINYATGVFSVTFASAPALGAEVTVDYNYDVIIGPGEYMVIAKQNAQVADAHPGVQGIIGDFGGSLSDRGERIVLSKPDDPLLPLQDFIVVDEVVYTDGESWGKWADGGGSSLELIDPHSDNMRASNWADSDETNKADWTLVTYTGELDLGRNAADEVQILLEGTGEALLDDVEVFRSGQSNLVGNSTFEGGAGGWVIQGTHIDSHLETSEGYASSQSLHLVSSRTGDNSVNRVEHDLSANLADGDIATIQARVRWLAGTPGILLRLHGNWLEAPGFMNIPANLGSPGAANSQYAVNAGPAIYDVTHLPVLPAAGEDVVVTARVTDVDGLSSVELKYRNDTDAPSTSYTVTMNDSGVSGDAIAGDGVYSATIPGQGDNDLVAFYVEATDSHASSLTTRFPTADDGEAHVMFGQTPEAGTFGTYRFWMTEADRVEWANRQKFSDHPIHGTFVYGDFRAIYNAGGRFRGSPFIRSNGDPESKNTSYVFYVPKDSRVIGSTSFNLDRLEGDSTKQRERISLWLADQVDTPFFNQRYVHLYVNQNGKSTIYGDSHSPNDDFVNAYWSGGTDGELFKIDDWFEFNDNSQVSKEFNDNGQLRLYLTGGQKNQARYRWSWRKEPMGGFNDDYSLFFELVDAVNYDYQSTQFAATAPVIIDYDEWMHTFAIQHAINNWDSYGFNRGKNMSLYMPDDGQWQMLMWDLDHSHLTGGTGDNNLFSINDPILKNEFFNYPLFRRAYWRSLFEIAEAMEASKIDPVMDANYAAFLNNGESPTEPSGVKTWVAERRAFLLGQVAAIDSVFSITTNGGLDYNTGTQIVTITGTAQVAVKTMKLNGVEVDPDFTSLTNWELEFGLSEGENVLTFEGYDFKGNLIATDSITVTFTNTAVSPLGQIVINELMYNPAAGVEQGEFIEIYNASGGAAFDLSGWRIDGVDFTFAPGSIVTADEYVIVAENTANFTSIYGSTHTVLGEFNGSMSNGGERLRLQMPAEGGLWTTVDEVTYGDDLPWPEAADGTGPSLQLIDPAKDNGWIGNWSADAVTPFTPGAVNSVDQNLPAHPHVRINEILGNNVSDLADNMGDYDPWIELYDAGGMNVMAVEVHQANPDGADATMELSLTVSEPVGNETVWLVKGRPQGSPSTWTYLDDGSDQGTAWRDPEYDDGAWSTGQGRFGYGDSQNTLLSYGSDSNNKHITYYFRQEFDVPDPSLFTALDLLVQRDDGIIVYLNDNEVMRKNMPTSGVDYQTLAIGGAVSGPDEVAWIAPSVPVSTSYLVTGTNVISVEMHQVTPSSSDLGFDLSLSGERAIVGSTTDIIPLDATWQYLDDGSDQGSTWREPGFDDTGWSTGQAILGYGNGDETTTLAGGATTYYFRHAITLPGSSTLNPVLDVRSDDGVVVYLNGTEVFRVNMPAGPISSTTEALAPVEGGAEADFARTVIDPSYFLTDAGLGLLDDMYLTDDYSQLLKWSFPTGTPLASGEYQTVWVDGEPGEQDASNLHTSFALDGLPGSLALVWNYGGTPIVVDYVDYDYTPDDQSQGLWPNGQGEMFAMSSTTPAAFNSGPAMGQIIINEVHYNPDDSNDYEFIELFNRGPSTVNLWETYASIDYPWELEGFEFAPGTTMLSNETVVVVSFNPITNPVKLAAFKTRYGLESSSVQILGSYGANLDNGGGMIRLERPLPLVGSPAFTPYETVDAVRYDDEAPWATAPDGLGASLHRLLPDAWGNNVDNWTSAPPNPGAFTIANSAPYVANPIADLTVDEDDSDTVLDLSAAFSDVDVGDLLTLVVTGNTNVGLVTTSLVGTNLTLSYVSDQNGAADITVRASDSGGLWIEDVFTVTVDPVEDSPVLVNPIADMSVDEDSGSDLLDLSATFHDGDVPPDTLTLTVTGNTNPGLVTTSVVGTGLTLSYVPGQDGVADITVRATDASLNWVEDTFTLTVNPINHAPYVDVLISDVQVQQDSPDTPVDLSPTFMDDDLGDTLTYSVSINTNPSLVTTSVLGNVLTLSYAAGLTGVADITVRATDSGAPGLFIEDTFTVTVTTTNAAPTVVAPIADVGVVENDPDTILSLASVFFDAEDGSNLTLTVEGNTNPALVTTGMSGSQLTLSYAADQYGSADITIRATDFATPGLWVEDTFTVTVSSDNLAPTVANEIADVAASEDDPDTLVSLSDVFDDSVGLKPMLDYTVVEIDPVTGAEAAGTGLFRYTFTLYGNDGVESVFATTTLTFTGAIQQVKAFVTADVNDELNAGIFEGIAGSGYIAGLDTWIFAGWQEIAPNDTSLPGSPVVLSVGSGTAAYFEQKDLVQIVATGDVQWTGTHSRLGADYPTSGTADADRLVYSISDNTNPGLVTASIVSSQLTLAYAPGASGSADVTIRATDPEGAWVEDTFTVTVDPVNDAPSFTAGSDVVIDQGAGSQTVVGWATGISPGPADEAGQALTFAVTNNTNPGLFSTGPAVSADGTLTFTPAGAASGSATITLELSDDGGVANGGQDTSAPQLFTITVNSINVTPSFTAGPDVTVDEDDGPQTVVGWATDISAGPPEEAGQVLSFAVTNNTNPTLFSVAPAVSADGTLTFTAAADANGSATITLELSDDGGGQDTSAPQQFTITVDPVNDTPSFTAGPDVTVDEDDGSQTVVGWATGISAGPADESGQVLSFAVTNNTNPTLFSVAPAVSADGTLTFTAAANASGSATITLELSDNGGGQDTSAPQQFLITVDPVNDTPSFTAGPDVTVDEDDGPQTVVGWATGISAGPADESGQVLSFAVTNNTNPTLFSVAPAVSADGTLTFTAAADANGSATITLELSDNGGGLDTSAPQQFLITVDPVNDTPSFTAGPDVTVDEDDGPQTVVGWATGISAGPADESGQVLSFAVTNNTNPTLFSVAPAVSADGTLTFTSAPDAFGVADVTVQLSDNGGGQDTSAPQVFRITVNEVPDAAVVGRHVFYNNSVWDTGDDNAAVAPDKTALLPGGTATVANSTSYNLGINGIMVDIEEMGGTPRANDFDIEVNASNDPNTWSNGPAPTVTVHPGEGVGGSDRVKLIWADGAIRNQWVKVTVRATGKTGLGAADVFYYGNAVGDIDGDGVIGDGDYDALVGEFGQRGGVGVRVSDLDADGRVGLRDFVILRSSFGDEVQAPTVPAPAPPAAAAPAVEFALQSTSQPSSEEPIASDDSTEVLASADMTDLLVVSSVSSPLGGSESMTETTYYTATGQDDLAALSDEPSSSDGLDPSIEVGDPLVDLLNESSIFIPLG